MVTLLAFSENGTISWVINWELNIPEITLLQSPGGFHNLALKNDGTVIAWGRNHYGQTSVPEGLNNIVNIVAGTAHSSAIKSNGEIISWEVINQTT